MEKKFIPSRLIDARNEKGLTQTELANLCENCSRVTISKLENGLTEPQSKTIIEINKVLKKSLDYYFIPESTDIIGETPIIFRSFNSKTVLNRKQAIILKKQLTATIQYIFSYLNEIPINIQKELYIEDPLELTMNEIERLASNLRNYWNLSSNPIDNLVVIAENNGIICSSLNLPARIDAFNIGFSLKHNNQSCRAIVYEKKSSYFRQRFDIAHELGHILMHSSLDETEIQVNNKIIEKQANKFASAFLLPKESFIYSINKFDLSNLIELKKIWGASIAAIIYRLNDLNLITDRRKNNLYIEMSRKKWKTIEPLDKETEKENPYLIEEAFKFLFKSEKFSPILVSKKTGLSFDELNKLSGSIDLFGVEQLFFDPKFNFR